MTGVTLARDIPLADLRALRLRRQLIADEPGSATDARTVEQTVSRLLCVQAQDFGQALWGVGLRTPGSTRTSVLDALDTGAIVRSWPMRGTLHFIAAADLRWMLALTAGRSMRSAARRLAETGVDEATIALGTRIARTELAGGCLTRTEFMRALQAAGINTDGQRGYHLIFALAQAGLICWGPMRGTQQALVLVEEWIPEERAVIDGDDPVEALGELALRYFAAHGPATERDLAWWAKLPLTAVRSGIARVRDRLAEGRFGEVSYFVVAAGEGDGSGDLCSEDSLPGRATDDSVAVHALPGFDEYLLGYQNRDTVLDPRHSEAVVPGKNGLFRPILVAGGEVVGVWRRETRSAAEDRARPALIAEPFRPLDEDEQAALAVESERYRAFLER